MFRRNKCHICCKRTVKTVNCVRSRKIEPLEKRGLGYRTYSLVKWDLFEVYHLTKKQQKTLFILGLIRSMPLQFFKFRELPLLFVYLEPCHYYFISTRLVPFCTLDAALGPHADHTRRILLLRAHLQTVWLKVPLAKNEPRESGLIHSPSLTDCAAPRVRCRPSPLPSPSPPLPFLLLRRRREAQHE